MKAIVQKIVYGEHGKYVVATPTMFTESITFALSVWKESSLPEAGSVIFLEDIQEKRAGWRALSARYYRIEDERPAKSSDGKYFIRPGGSQFPFSFVSAQIVNELEKRNWSVPGIKVEFDTWGSGEENFRCVRYVKGDDFEVHFHSSHINTPSGIVVCTTASQINIPQYEIQVHSDESGPTFYVYVGDDWNRDRTRFVQGIKVNSKLNREPRFYLRYKGGCLKPGESGYQHTYSGKRPPYLVHDSDLGREYSPKNGEREFFETKKTMNMFADWLQKNVLQLIFKTPQATELIDPFQPEKPIPFPALALHFFAVVDYQNQLRIEAGKLNKQKLEPKNRFAIMPSLRGLELGVRNDGTFSEIVKDGMCWIGVSENMIELSGNKKDYSIPFNYRNDTYSHYLIRIDFNRANHVYIVDINAGEEYKEKIFDENPKLTHLTDSQYDEFRRSIARTMTPISEYNGSFKDPVVWVNREIDFDEVTILGKI